MAHLVVAGAGLFGLTVAERAANAGYKVIILELKDRVGGNVASHIDEQTGIEVHDYGSHIFHTSNERVWEYVNQFTEFTPYNHRVRTTTKDGRVIPLPFGLSTFSTYYNRAFTPDEMRELVATFPQGQDDFEQTAISSIGKDLYTDLVEGYTRKQWGCEPKDLPSSTIKRLPVRYTWNDGYFTDKYQGIPKDGYQAWLERMADHPNIQIMFNTDILKNPTNLPLVYTGPIDAYFNYKFGHLGWRTVDLVEERPETNDYQGCAVMNYADPEIPFTRIHEYKHYRPEGDYTGTIIHKEYSREAEHGEMGAYPINTPADREMLKQYRQAVSMLKDVWFGGRLGSYAYLDMHAAIASALTLWENEVQPHLEGRNGTPNRVSST
jgi:UDP-galactopyranose mutase